MGEVLQEFPISCDRGGFNYNPNIDTIPAYAMVNGSKNLNLNKGGRKPRGGTSKVTGVSRGSSRGMGIIQYSLKNGTSYIVSASAAGNIYKNDTATIHTGWTINKHVSFEVIDELLFACNGADRPRYWDGAAASMTQMTTLHADWTGVNFPSKFIVHGRGVSERLWACGCPTTPYTVYVSANGNGNDFSTGGGGKAIDISTGDEYGIVDLAVFGDRIFAIGKHRVYLIDDTDAAVANWGYGEAIWRGGGNKGLVINSPSDLISFQETGDIYSVVAAFQTGDYQYASLSNPLTVPIAERPYIQLWIQELVDMLKIDNFHCVDDPINRCIYFFVTPTGYLTNKTALVYYYDRPPAEAWMIHENLSYASGYDASASCLVEVAVGNYQVYTIDYSGMIWKLQTTNLNDDSNSYYKGWIMPYTGCTLSHLEKEFAYTKTITQPEGDHNLIVNTWVDNTQLAQGTISLGGVGAGLDSFVLDTDTLGGDALINHSKANDVIGKRIKHEFFNSSINEDFFISAYSIFFEPLGLNP